MKSQFDEIPFKPLRPPVPSRPTEESKKKLQSIQNDVDEVKLVMVNNIDKVLLRGEAIDKLLDKSDDLQHNANIFQRSTRVLKRKMCCKNAKANMILIIVVSMFISLLILIIVLSTKPWNK